MFIIFFGSVFGCLFVLRIIGRWVDEGHISASVFIFSLLIYFCFLGSLIFAITAKAFYYVCLAQLPAIGLYGFNLWNEFRNKKKFRREFCNFVYRVLLAMKVGSSFRQSIQAANSTNNSFVREKIQMLYSVVAFSQQFSETKNLFFRRAVTEFIRMDRCSHHGLKRLEQFHRALKTEEDFRQKSGQVIHHLLTQATIVLLLFVTLLVYVIATYGFYKYSSLIITSVLLNILGLGWIYCLQARWRWKV